MFGVCDLAAHEQRENRHFFMAPDDAAEGGRGAIRKRD